MPVLKSLDLSESEVKKELAIAIAFEVPVVPNTESVAGRLSELHNDVIQNGFEETRQGISQRYQLVDRAGPLIGESGEVDLPAFVQPMDAVILRNALLLEQEESRHVKSLIRGIQQGLIDLAVLLESEQRNENALQRCLTSHPIFFGPEYKRIVPKYRLGKEYEADYALELMDGSVDMIEIEASSHRLYTTKGNPSQHLVHAEQQVLDWLSWLDENSAYARVDLPGLRRPRGFVIIGRSSNETDRKRLSWRNHAYNGRLTILTYDDMLEQATNLLRVLRGQDVK